MKLYKPTKGNKGAALSLNYTARVDKDGQKGDKSFYVQIVAQNGFDEKSGNGIFKDGKKIITKFAPHEISGMLAGIKRNISMADAMGVKYVYHDGESYKSTITFEPYFKSVKQGNDWVKSDTQSGFIYKVTKTDKNDESKKDTIAIGLNWAEMELLRIVLEDGLQHIANSWYAENIARGTEAKEKHKKSSPKQEQKVVEKEPEVDPDEPAPSADLDF